MARKPIVMQFLLVGAIVAIVATTLFATVFALVRLRTEIGANDAIAVAQEPISVAQPTPVSVPAVPQARPNAQSVSVPPPIPIAPPSAPPMTTPIVSLGGGFGVTVPRFHFNIAPTTPLKNLLPVPPQNQPTGTLVLDDDLTKVPEILFQEPLAKNIPVQQALKDTAHTIAKINHVNHQKPDAFMEALLGQRPDLAGLPFAMGESCRMKGERGRHFQAALNTIRQIMGPLSQQSFRIINVSSPPPPGPPIPSPSNPHIQAQLNNSTGQLGSPPPAPNPAPSKAGLPPGMVPVAASVLSTLVDSTGKVLDNRETAEQFWQSYQTACLKEDQVNAKKDTPYQKQVTLARIAALMQVMAPKSPDMRMRLVGYLATISHPEATRALAKLAIFSKERQVRAAACNALKVRRDRDYTQILLKGLHYPWPAVAKHAAQAMVKLDRQDLIPQLVSLIEEPDPRLPVLTKVGAKSAPVVKELVRINHLRNCVMCHAPGGNAPLPGGDLLTAQVPVPGEPLPLPSQGYGNSQPDILVRFDVTYLRQDFSAMLAVADSQPWPEMQRFDFLVRSRAVTEAEAGVYQKKLTKSEPGFVTPYQRAALAALRELTGRDTAPTASAWRKLLGL